MTRTERQEREAMKLLSDDAKGLAACLWSLPIGRATVLSFHMQEVRPTARGQVALDELTAAGFLYRETLPGGGASYRPMGPDMAMFRRFKKLGAFPLTEPICDVTGV